MSLFTSDEVFKILNSYLERYAGIQNTLSVLLQQILSRKPFTQRLLCAKNHGNVCMGVSFNIYSYSKGSTNYFLQIIINTHIITHRQKHIHKQTDTLIVHSTSLGLTHSSKVHLSRLGSQVAPLGRNGTYKTWYLVGRSLDHWAHATERNHGAFYLLFCTSWSVYQSQPGTASPHLFQRLKNSGSF